MKRLMRRNSSPFSDTNTSNDTSSRINGGTDSSRFMSSIEDTDAPGNQEAHVNPAANPETIDRLDGSSPSFTENKSDFLQDLENATNRPFYKSDSSIGYKT